MPKPDAYAASVTVACEGPGIGSVQHGPLGIIRSRDGARLAHVRADAHYWNEQFRTSSPVDYHALLVNPTRDEVTEALSNATEALAPFASEPGWVGGQVDFAFSGHGSPTGGLVLSDGEFKATDLIDPILFRHDSSDRTRKLGLVLDSCYSGRTMAQILTDERQQRDFLVIDGFAACLHDESAWEFEYLEHGVLTFSMRHRGNAHVDSARLARAVWDGDGQYLRFALHAFTPNSVSFITDGQQTSIDVINGHLVQIPGGGETELPDTPSLPRMLDDLDRGRSSLFQKLGL